MKGQRFTPEKIIGLLRQAEVELAQASGWAKSAGVWGFRNRATTAERNEYGGLKLEQARRMKDLEKENSRLKQAVAELTLDKQILKEALEGNL